MGDQSVIEGLVRKLTEGADSKRTAASRTAAHALSEATHSGAPPRSGERDVSLLGGASSPERANPSEGNVRGLRGLPCARAGDGKEHTLARRCGLGQGLLGAAHLRGAAGGARPRWCRTQALVSGVEWTRIVFAVTQRRRVRRWLNGDAHGCRPLAQCVNSRLQNPVAGRGGLTSTVWNRKDRAPRRVRHAPHRVTRRSRRLGRPSGCRRRRGRPTDAEMARRRRWRGSCRAVG
jgi:hypothetical protein